MPSTLPSEIVRSRAASLRADPTQFHIDVSIIGTQAIGGAAGPGLSVVANGGGSGTTIGFVSRADGGGMQIGPAKTPDERFAARVSEWADELDAIADRLATPQRDSRGWFDRTLDRLRNEGVPAVVIAVETQAVTGAFGLG